MKLGGKPLWDLGFCWHECATVIEPLHGSESERVPCLAFISTSYFFLKLQQNFAKGYNQKLGLGDWVSKKSLPNFASNIKRTKAN